MFCCSAGYMRSSKHKSATGTHSLCNTTQHITQDVRMLAAKQPGDGWALAQRESHRTP